MTGADLELKIQNFNETKRKLESPQFNWEFYADENEDFRIYKLALDKQLEMHNSLIKRQNVEARARWDWLYSGATVNMIENLFMSQINKELDAVIFKDFQRDLNPGDEAYTDYLYSAYAKVTRTLQTYMEFSLLKNNPFFIKDFLKFYRFRVSQGPNSLAVVNPKMFMTDTRPTKLWVENGMPIMTKHEIKKLKIDAVKEKGSPENF